MLIGTISLLSLSSCSPNGGITSERRSELIEMTKVETFAAAFEGCPSSKLVLGVGVTSLKQRDEGSDETFDLLPLIMASGFKNYGEPLKFNVRLGDWSFSYYPWKSSGSGTDLDQNKKVFFHMTKELTHFYIENMTEGEYSPDPNYEYVTCYEITKEEGEMLFAKAQEIIDR